MTEMQHELLIYFLLCVIGPIGFAVIVLSLRDIKREVRREAKSLRRKHE